MLTLVPSDRADAILEAIVGAADLNAVGRGIAFVLPVDKVVGVARFLEEDA